jgi:hypothetical protein
VLVDREAPRRTLETVHAGRERRPPPQRKARQPRERNRARRHRGARHRRRASHRDPAGRLPSRVNRIVERRRGSVGPAADRQSGLLNTRTYEKHGSRPHRRDTTCDGPPLSVARTESTTRLGSARTRSPPEKHPADAVSGRRNPQHPTREALAQPPNTRCRQATACSDRDNPHCRDRPCAGRNSRQETRRPGACPTSSRPLARFRLARHSALDELRQRGVRAGRAQPLSVAKGEPPGSRARPSTAWSSICIVTSAFARLDTTS